MLLRCDGSSGHHYPRIYSYSITGFVVPDCVFAHCCFGWPRTYMYFVRDPGYFKLGWSLSNICLQSSRKFSALRGCTRIICLHVLPPWHLARPKGTNTNESDGEDSNTTPSYSRLRQRLMHPSAPYWRSLLHPLLSQTTTFFSSL